MSKGVHEGVHKGVHELSKVVTLWSPKKAAEECGVSRSTIMRKLYADEIPGAEKVGISWVIPVPGLIAAGLTPGVPSPPENQEKNQGVHEGVHKGVQNSSVDTLELKHQLELAELRERSLRQELEMQKALSEERAARIEDLQTALRMLEPGESDRKKSIVETPAQRSESEPKTISDPVTVNEPVVQEPQPQGFMTRLRHLFS